MLVVRLSSTNNEHTRTYPHETQIEDTVPRLHSNGHLRKATHSLVPLTNKTIV